MSSTHGAYGSHIFVFYPIHHLHCSSFPREQPWMRLMACLYGLRPMFQNQGSCWAGTGGPHSIVFWYPFLWSDEEVWKSVQITRPPWAVLVLRCTPCMDTEKWAGNAMSANNLLDFDFIIFNLKSIAFSGSFLKNYLNMLTLGSSKKKSVQVKMLENQVVLWSVRSADPRLFFYVEAIMYMYFKFVSFPPNFCI